VSATRVSAVLLDVEVAVAAVLSVLLLSYVYVVSSSRCLSHVSVSARCNQMLYRML